MIRNKVCILVCIGLQLFKIKKPFTAANLSYKHLCFRISAVHYKTIAASYNSIVYYNSTITVKRELVFETINHLPHLLCSIRSPGWICTRSPPPPPGWICIRSLPRLNLYQIPPSVVFVPDPSPGWICTRSLPQVDCTRFLPDLI